MKKNLGQLQSGFAMLFTVLVVSLMLAIGLGISDLTFKQTVLSSLAQNSQLAFYQADSGVECGLYYSQTLDLFPRGTTVSGSNGAPASITCGTATATLLSSQSLNDYFVYQEQVSPSTLPCFSIIFDKTDPVDNSISSRGFSTCSSTPQQVERGLNVTY